MKQALKLLISLYPKSWRNRYESEFAALLDAVPPTWRTLFDVLGGALKMQMKSGGLWKAAAAAAVVALLTSVTLSRLAPSPWKSEAVIRPDEARFNAAAAKVLSRAGLTQLIVQENLYEKDRARVPMDDLALRLRSGILIWSDRGDGSRRVRVTAPDAAEAQRAAQGIADAFVAANAAVLVDPANLPGSPDRPPLGKAVQAGLIVGLLAGALFALFTGLHVWKLVAACGAAGALLGAAAASVVPNTFEGLSAVSCRTADGTTVRRLIDSATSSERLASMVRQFNLYPGDPRAEQLLRENLTVKPDLRPFGNPLTGTPKGSYDIAIHYQYPDRTIAQSVTEAVAAYLTDENVQRRAGITLEMVAPAFVHQRQPVSNRLIGSGAGLLLGLVCAVLLGLWRAWTARRQLKLA